MANQRSGPVQLPSLLELQAPTLNHMSEAPGLAATLARAVQASLETGQRFPHLLLIGPADSGKQTIAATVARELGAPLVCINPASLQGPDELHDILMTVPRGAVVLVGNLEGQWAISSDLCRVAQGNRVRKMPTPPWALSGESWKRTGADEPYRQFTIIATTRDIDAERYGCTAWAELVLYTTRTASTESLRIDRTLRRVGLAPDTEALAKLSEFAVNSGVRTLRLARSIALWAGERNATTLNAELATVALGELSDQLVEPARLVRLRSGKPANGRKSATSPPDEWSDASATDTASRETGPTTKQLLAASVLVVAILASAMFLAMGTYHLVFGRLPSP